jgi:hypothetical protein
MRARELPRAVRTAIDMLTPIQTLLEHPKPDLLRQKSEARRAEALRMQLGEILAAVQQRPKRGRR